MQHSFYFPQSREEFKEILQEVINEAGISKEKDSTPSKNINAKVLTRKAAAAYLNISLPTLNERTKDGTIKASRLKGRVLYYQSELDNALANYNNLNSSIK
jgi:excisionase family DNA binding protein